MDTTKKLENTKSSKRLQCLDESARIGFGVSSSEVYVYVESVVDCYIKPKRKHCKNIKPQENVHKSKSLFLHRSESENDFDEKPTIIRLEKGGKA